MNDDPAAGRSPSEFPFGHSLEVSASLPETESVPFEERDEELVAIDGARVVRKILVLREGWEADEDAWILEDGRVFGTDHNRLYEMDGDDIEGLLGPVARSLHGLLEARATVKEREGTT